MKKDVSVFLIPISSPMLIGIYEDDKLIKTIEESGKTTDTLPDIFRDILKSYNVLELFYVNGPGSYMSIKITYIFLKTLSIANDIKFKACSGFDTNENSPIKSLGKKHFVLNNGKIEIVTIKEDTKISPFVLPKKLNKNDFHDDCIPDYQLKAIS